MLRTLGYPGRAIACLVVGEGGMLGLAGGIAGVGLSAAFLRWRPDKPPRECTYGQLETATPYELKKIFR